MSRKGCGKGWKGRGYVLIKAVTHIHKHTHTSTHTHAYTNSRKFWSLDKRQLLSRSFAKFKTLRFRDYVTLRINKKRTRRAKRKEENIFHCERTKLQVSISSMGNIDIFDNLHTYTYKYQCSKNFRRIQYMYEHLLKQLNKTNKFSIESLIR